MEDHFECPICARTLARPASLPCGHNFCLDLCLAPWYGAAAPPVTCPLCRGRMPPLAELRVNSTLEAGIAALARAHAQARAPPPLRAVDPALLTTLAAPLLGEGSFGASPRPLLISPPLPPPLIITNFILQAACTTARTTARRWR